jgi:hypothetical protein
MIIAELLKTLYAGGSPHTSVDAKYVDNGYPHTNIIPDLLRVLFTTIAPNYIVECGSMLGGSAIRMAETLKSIQNSTEIVCIDPFTGDVNMWDWETTQHGWKFLRLENGIPTIYKRFLANIQAAGFQPTILPINATTSVGVKLLQRLASQKRISSLPNYIYLDSAHEKDETFIELSICWNALTSAGILFGDDWGWDAVRDDVIKFSNTIKTQSNMTALSNIQSKVPGSTIHNSNILLYKGQWVLFKA